MKLSFKASDIGENHELMVKFRADSYSVSFGDPSLSFEADGRSPERYLELLERRNQLQGSCVHVLCDELIVGQVELRFMDDGEGGDVNLFYLSPEWRSHGYGQQLDSYAKRFFMSHGRRKAYLNVSPTNSAALRFYSKNGWRIIDRIFKSGADVFVMKKEYS